MEDGSRISGQPTLQTNSQRKFSRVRMQYCLGNGIIVACSQLDRDKRKIADLKRLGITVVHVGYWWDGSWSHLRSTLLAVDPSNLPQFDTCILIIAQCYNFQILQIPVIHTHINYK